jgi:hypothetical protein
MYLCNITNTHKIEINFKINEILAVDSSEDIFKIMNLNDVEILLKQNVNTKNKLLNTYISYRVKL